MKTWYTHTHTRLMALLLGLPRRAGTRKVKPIWILLKQERVSGSGISWAICKSAPCSRQPHQHPTTLFLQARCPSAALPTEGKALKGLTENQIMIDNNVWPVHIEPCPLPPEPHTWPCSCRPPNVCRAPLLHRRLPCSDAQPSPWDAHRYRSRRKQTCITLHKQFHLVARPLKR